jgi:hypothetical protein
MGTKLAPDRFDCWESAEPDEPVFVLAGRDADAPATVESWALRRLRRIVTGDKPPDDIAKVRAALDCAQAMRKWHAKRTGAAPPAPADTTLQIEAALRVLEAER